MPIRFEDIYETVRRHHPSADLELLRKAYIFSAVEHKGQTRASGEPYLVHPLEVAAVLAEMRMDPACVAVGLLHDVLEDTLTEPERIKEYFGDDVLHMVEGVTKISKIPFSSSEERQAENFRKLLLAMVDDVRVILVKLADRLHNMRTLQYLPDERRVRIARETMDIYAPLAGRLGMSKIKNELEDLSFQYLEPEAYKELTARVEERRAWALAFIDKVKAALVEKLQAAGLEATVEGRTKRLYSIQQKLRRQRIELDQVYDFVALRVVVNSIPDCYAVLGILHNVWRPVPGRIKDFIAMPRPNGYQALHTSVIGDEGHPFEVQIRTLEMHRVAEDGIAAHWKYKEGKSGFDQDDQAFAWLRQLLEWQQEVKDPHEFLNSLKLDLYPEEVYCFTPKGEVKTLPRGATPIDFAYAIHTDIGRQCVGARVNGKMIPLRYKLNNGDIVEILTAAGHKPSRDWLSLAVTNKARAKIRHYLNSAEKQQAVDIGKKHFERELKRYELSLKKLEPGKLDALPQELGAGSKLEDLYAALGYGKLSMRQVIARLVPPDKLREAPPPDKPRPLADAVKRLLRVGEERITVKGSGDLLIYRARCCNPIMGEPIVGYITRGKGVSVHSQTCPNVVNLMYDPERRIAVEWERGGEDAYEVRIAVEVEDRPGLLADITAVLAGASADIRDAQARTFDDRTAAIDLTLRIQDLKHLERVLKSIRGVSGVLDVERQSVAR
ncbi:MAG TPA: bifunctional (p)ppGpp synthetase/guanosine-3',5'-bis(diphosphate) 3'-pyrophosphohydrolase [Vicinamibacteria bacterium]|nr:bifunctional (p)ppGpp synthetase/guanosine-3',5'-bis(diphosphate) 3'-pyrophosphohydrolase [Vicinamibacteria bacterium]